MTRLETIGFALTLITWLIIGIVVLAITSGCATRSVSEITLTPSGVEVVASNIEGIPSMLEVITISKSRDLQMAMDLAKHRARVKLADYRKCNLLIGSHVIQQDIEHDGISWMVAVKMQMPNY